MKRKTLIILLIFCSVVHLRAQRPLKAYRTGKKNYENGEYSKAIDWLSLSIDSKKNKFNDAYLYRAKSYLGLGQHSKAIKDFKIATQILPNNIEAPLSTARLMIEQKKYPLALQYATITLDRDSKNLEALKLQIHALSLTGDAESALIAIKSIDQDKIDSELIYIKAVASDSLNLTDNAIKYYNEAIEKQPNFIDAYHALGMLLAKNGYNKRSEQIFSLAARRFNDEKSYYYRSLINNKTEHKQSEIIDITKILTLNRSRVDLYFNRALLFKESNLLQNALSDINIYLQWDSTSASAWILKAQILNKMLMKKEALTAYEKVLKLTDNRLYITEAKENIFKLNTENIPPIINLNIGSINVTRTIMADKDASEIILKGIVIDDNKIENIKINNVNIPFEKLQKNKYTFSSHINSTQTQNVIIEATDIYKNKNRLNLPIIKTNNKSRMIFLTSPKTTSDSIILTTEQHLNISGFYLSDAFFSSLKINGKEIPRTLKKNKFHFNDQLEINNIDTLVIEATDIFSNTLKYNYPIIKKYNLKEKTSTLGKTWVVVVASDKINGHKLPEIHNHYDSIINAYKYFVIDSLVLISGQSKEKLERTLLFSLPKQIEQNRVNAVLLHYIGPGEKEGDFSYLIVDSEQKEHYERINTTFFKTVFSSINNVSYKTLITETVAPGKHLINFCLSDSITDYKILNRIPDQGVFILGVFVKNWHTYQSPILKSLKEVVKNKERCFIPINISKQNNKVFLGSYENKTVPIFPIILHLNKNTY